MRHALLKLIDIIDANELAITWLGIVLALVGVVISPASTLSFILATFIGIACLLLGLLTAALIRRRRYLQMGKSCARYYEIDLPGEGQISVIKETQLLHAKRQLETVVLAVRYIEGEVLEESVIYKNFGKHGKDAKTAIPHTLAPDQIVPNPVGSTIRVLLPVPAARHELLEFEWVYKTRNQFRKAKEAVSKPVLFPIGQLRLELTFPSESVANVALAKSVAGLGVAFVPVQPTVDNDRSKVAWAVGRVWPSEEYSVQWTWKPTTPAETNQGARPGGAGGTPS
jgi:hypothetical protein